ncbi:MAG: hypothetical protein V3V08_21855 [Nannocystaceae bacterium]
MKREDVPQLFVEQLALDELPRAAMERLQDRLGDQLQVRLDAVALSNVEILSELPPSAVAREVSRRGEASRRQRRQKTKQQLWVTVPTMAAAAVVLLWVRDQPKDQSTQSTQSTQVVAAVEVRTPVAPTAEIESTRSKGMAPHLTVARKRGSEIEQLEDGSAVQPGDVLQLGYVASGRTHGVILSFDGRGVVTLHHPAQVSASTELDGLGEVALDFSYQLDDAPNFERFMFVTFDREQVVASSVDAAAIVRAAETLARDKAARTRQSLALPDAFEQSSLLLRKPAQ